MHGVDPRPGRARKGGGWVGPLRAPDEPPSWLGSATRLYDGVLAERPQWAERLADGFAWDRVREVHDGEAPASGYRVPAFSRAPDGRVSCRYFTEHHFMAYGYLPAFQAARRAIAALVRAA